MSILRRARAYGGPQPLPEGELPPLARDLNLLEALAVFPATGQRVFRLIGRGELRERDFQSDLERGRPRGPKQDFLDYVGLSAWGTLEAAKENAVRWPKIVADVRLDSGNGFMIARTFADIDHHYSVWGETERLLRCVGLIHRFDPE